MFSKNLKENNIEFHLQIKFWTVIFILLSAVKFAFIVLLYIPTLNFCRLPCKVVSVYKANCEVLSIGFGQCTYETPKLCPKIVVPGYSHCQEYPCPHGKHFHWNLNIGQTYIT